MTIIFTGISSLIVIEFIHVTSICFLRYYKNDTSWCNVSKNCTCNYFISSASSNDKNLYRLNNESRLLLIMKIYPAMIKELYKAFINSCGLISYIGSSKRKIKTAFSSSIYKNDNQIVSKDSKYINLIKWVNI